MVSSTLLNRREFLALPAAGALAPEQGSAVLPNWRGNPGETAAPFTYCIDYSVDHAENEKFVPTVAAAPPHLLHVGHDLAFKSASGPRLVPLPVKGTSKFQLLNPAETRALQKAIQGMVTRLHETGVKAAIPYIDNQQMGGDSERRSGFWELYDRWDDYREFGLPPKPPVDPIHWMQKDPEGVTQFNEPKAYPSYLPESFYAPCPNNPHWRSWLAFVIGHIVECGYDGVFVDNNILHCYCPDCRAAFQRYLPTRCKPAELRQAFGTADFSGVELHWGADKTDWAKRQPEFRRYLLDNHKPGQLQERFKVKDLASIEELNQIGSGYLNGRAREFIAWLQQKYSRAELEKRYGAPDLNQLGLQTSAERLRWYETQRFWCWSIAEHLLFLQRAANKRRPDFLLVPNWGAMSTIGNVNGRRLYGKNIAEWRRGAYSLMFEEDGMPGRLAEGSFFGYISQYKFALANGVRPVVLPYGNYSGANVELANAEAAAGGGGAFVQGGYSQPEARRRYRAFFDKHSSLLEGFRPFAHVGVAFLYYQLHFENVANLSHTYQLKRTLGADHVLFNYLLEGDLTRDRLKGYSVVFLPAVAYLDHQSIGAITGWVEDGGVLVLTGDLPANDQYGRERSRPAFARSSPGSEPVQLGRGKLVWEKTPAPKLGERLSALTGKTLGVIPQPGFDSVKVNTYWKKKKGGDVVTIHLVNYDLDAKSEPRLLRDIPLSVLLPHGIRRPKARAQAIAPGADALVKLDARLDQGYLKFVLPELRIYRLIEVTLD